MGGALVDAFTDQLNQLAAGGMFDVGAFFGGIFEMALGLLASLIPGGGLLMGIAKSAVQGVGRMGGSLIRSAGRHHEGAWIEQFHGGGWPAMGGDEQPAVLQSGERVLSRSEVNRMGGRASVDAAAAGAGGGGGTIVIQAIDGESVQRFFAGTGGRAAFNTARLGRGSFGKLLRGRG